MFTGLIETVGTVSQASRGDQSLRLAVTPEAGPFDVAVGGSVSVSGACLTVERVDGNDLVFTAVYETLSRTTLVQLRRGDRVNLERAMRVGDRLDGHFVQGHVDGVGVLRSQRTVGDSVVATVSVPPTLMRFMAEKGSVALDGISLTIAGHAGDGIEVSLIPHTVANTTLTGMRPGRTCNIECDVLARYLYQLMQGTDGNDEDSAAEESLYTKMMRAGF